MRKVTDEQILEAIVFCKTEYKHPPFSYEFLGKLIAERAEMEKPYTKSALWLRVQDLIKRGLLTGVENVGQIPAASLSLTPAGYRAIGYEVG